MIGNITKGGGVKACLAYVLGKDKAKKIGGNLLGDSPTELASDYLWLSQFNPRVSRLICHISLSVRASEQIDEPTWSAIAADYLERMNFGLVPYVVVQHHDTEHNHIHIVAGRVRANGTCVSDKWDYYRSQQTIRWLEEKYGLSPSQPPQYEPYQPLANEKQVFEFLKQTIGQILPEKMWVKEFFDGLKEHQIQPKIVTTRNQKLIKGIRYEYQGSSFSGTELGADYTWKKVNQGVNSIVAIPPQYLSHPSHRHSEDLEDKEKKKKDREGKLWRKSGDLTEENSQHPNPDPQFSQSSQSEEKHRLSDEVLQKVRLHHLAPAITKFLQGKQGTQFKGKWFTYYRPSGSELIVTRNEDDSLVFHAVKESNYRWRGISLQISDLDYNRLQALTRTNIRQSVTQPRSRSR
jgi:hypothetical protein